METGGLSKISILSTIIVLSLIKSNHSFAFLSTEASSDQENTYNQLIVLWNDKSSGIPTSEIVSRYQITKDIPSQFQFGNPTSIEYALRFRDERFITDPQHPEFDAQIPFRHGIKHSDVLKCYLAMLAYNILRWVGQNCLLGTYSPKRNKAKRRRIKTVMQGLMYVMARIVKTSRLIKLSFGRGRLSLNAFSAVCKTLAYG